MSAFTRALTTASTLVILSTSILVALASAGRAATVDLDLRAADLRVVASDGEARLALPGRARPPAHGSAPSCPRAPSPSPSRPIGPWCRPNSSAGNGSGCRSTRRRGSSSRWSPSRHEGSGVESVFADDRLAGGRVLPAGRGASRGTSRVARTDHGHGRGVSGAGGRARGRVGARRGDAGRDVRARGSSRRRRAEAAGVARLGPAGDRCPPAPRGRPHAVRVDAKSVAVDGAVSVEASAAVGPTLDSRPVQHLILTTTELAPSFQRLARPPQSAGHAVPGRDSRRRARHHAEGSGSGRDPPQLRARRLCAVGRGLSAAGWRHRDHPDALRAERLLSVGIVHRHPHGSVLRRTRRELERRRRRDLRRALSQQRRPRGRRGLRRRGDGRPGHRHHGGRRRCLRRQGHGLRDPGDHRLAARRAAGERGPLPAGVEDGGSRAARRGFFSARG